jgi:glucose/arabinose dehydrogenase
MRVTLIFALLAAAAHAQQRPLGFPPATIGPGPFLYDTAEHQRIKVTVLARGLVHPWSLAFLPDGDLLITERPGRLRRLHDGVLNPKALTGIPEVWAKGFGGLQDIALHPGFATNHWVYFSYIKPAAEGTGAPTIARAHLEGNALTDLREILTTDAYPGTSALSMRIAFAPDGLLYAAAGGNIKNLAQDPNSLRGKILRLRDDGSPAPGNPFLTSPGYRPEIYTLGHRNTLGLMVHPQTGAVWNTENGPNGGDEINIALPGRNYGWPTISYGRDYPGPRISEQPVREGFESPILVWLPSIAVSGMALYTGDRFPAWKGNLFVGAMRTGEIPGTGHLERIVFNAGNEELRRESLLGEFRHRIREVRQGPDGFLYVLTDEEDGVLLRIEPALE